MSRSRILSLLVLSYVLILVYRAVMIPITHDEAGTWFHYGAINVWSCFRELSCWPNANNHWMNTLLLQWSMALFGDDPWALRLPNTLAGIGYALAAGLICHRYVHFTLGMIGGWLLLCAHPYLMDFFSLARGYGLMTCGVIWGLYALLRYFDGFNGRWLWISLGAMSFAILSNFTALLPWAAFGAAWLGGLFLFQKQQLVFRHGWIWVFHAGLLLWLLWFPIKALSAANEFLWGAGTQLEMFAELWRSLDYGNGIISQRHHMVFVWISGGVLSGIVMCFVWIRRLENRKLVMWLALVLILNGLVIWTQTALTNANPPIGRKTIYWIPLIFSLLVMALGGLKHRLWAKWLALMVTVLMLAHVWGAFKHQLHSAREWYYDAYYPELFDTILPEGVANDSIHVESSWIFTPGLIFYRDTDGLPIGGLNYMKTLQVDTIADYYFLDPPDTTHMTGTDYELMKMIGPFFLYKKRE